MGRCLRRKADPRLMPRARTGLYQPGREGQNGQRERGERATGRSPRTRRCDDREQQGTGVYWQPDSSPRAAEPGPATTSQRDERRST